MGSYQNPVGGVPDPYEKYRAERAEERQSKEQSYGERKEKSFSERESLAAHVLKVLKKAVDATLEKIGVPSKESFSSKEHLKNLKMMFEALKSEDRSQDLIFLNDLSSLWNQCIEESLKFNEEALQIFREFVKKVLRYPEGSAHTFGYYLTEYAGQKWIPFPYMELIQNIHQEHEKNPDSNSLNEWTQLLDQAIFSLRDLL